MSRTLADYPHPSIAVDVALLTVTEDGRLAVLLHEREEQYETGRWSLPGTFVQVDETLRVAALRALRKKVGVTGQEPQQLRVFDAVDRDDRGRVMSVAHVDLVPSDRLEGTTGTLRRVDSATRRPVLPDGQNGLAFDHDEIVETAVKWARDAYRERPDPRRLIGEEFTLLELQRVHEAVLGRPWQKDTFRRHMVQYLDETGGLSRGAVGKPARLFRRTSPRGEHSRPI
ncbi:NUDIX domain-containing protein [Pseudonocardia aurantiaca]